MKLKLSRRQFLGVFGAGTALVVARPALAAPRRSSTLIERVRQELARLGTAIPLRDVVGIADYSASSSQHRFHLCDVASGTVRSFLVAHGRGSDPNHSGWVSRFSNACGSNASSEGAYLTGARYVGAHGRAMRLVGLDSTNNNAEKRAIVVHGAWYVSPEMLGLHGRLGRSEGCFAFSQGDVDTILARLGPGRLLLATKL